MAKLAGKNGWSHQSGAVLVTGAAGFLGAHTATALVATGKAVVGVGNKQMPHWCEAKLVDYVNADVSYDTIASLLELYPQIDTVFHCAGGSLVGAAEQDATMDYARTVGSTVNLLAAVQHKRPGLRLLYPSSAAVYGDRFGRRDSWGYAAELTKDAAASRISEEAPLEPVSTYGRHKLAAENLCMSAHREGVVQCQVIRFFSLYGNHLRKQLLWDISRRVLEGSSTITLGGTGEETRDFFHVQDAAQLVAQLCAEDFPRDGRILNGATGKAQTVSGLADQLVCTLADRLARVPPRVVYSSERRAGDPAHLVADVRELESFGFQADILLADGVADYAEWVVANAATALR